MYLLPGWKNNYHRFKVQNREPFHFSEAYLYIKLFLNDDSLKRTFLRKKKNYINELLKNEMVPDFGP